MSIPTTRTKENGHITLNPAVCKKCGTCVKICPDQSLVMKDGVVAVNPTPFFGCLACGQCVAACPTGAISVTGRCLSVDDFVSLPEVKDRTNFEFLYNLMLSRRSVRHFQEKPVEDTIVQKILVAAKTAPMGIPPSDVSVLVLNGKEKVAAFVADFVAHLKKTRWVFSRWFYHVMTVFMSKETKILWKDFVIPLCQFLIERHHKGEDWLLYNAPLALYFHGTAYSDPADPVIAATYAMLAGESLGLGSCMIGSVSPMIKSGAKALKKKYNLPAKIPSGLVVIFGHPKYKFQRAIKRSFARENIYR